jgi:undecaprenyl-phosphate 4-deoxy-4-formamido-L-arabinose transferase
MNISVIIPVYNSEQTLAALVSRLQPVLEAEAAEYELVLVNDSSSDQSWDVISDLSVTHSWIRGINLMRNYGQHKHGCVFIAG